MWHEKEFIFNFNNVASGQRLVFRFIFFQHPSTHFLLRVTWEDVPKKPLPIDSMVKMGTI
jgi:hypothetical protein